MTESTDKKTRLAEQVRQEIQKRDQAVKVWLLLVSLASVALLVTAALQENVFMTWRDHQRRYGELLEDKADDEWGQKLAADYRVELAQIVLDQLGTTDRCITCHRGIDDPRMNNVPNPYRVHPGAYLEWHEADKFGCTNCHLGQGRAVELEAAHGIDEHEPEVILTGEQAFTRCSICHYENDLYGAREDLYSGDESSGLIDQAELSAIIPGFEHPRAQSLVRGKQLLLSSGCLGCHTYRGRGGKLGPDISYVGDKTKHDFDFTHIRGRHTVRQWLAKHLEHPAEVTPGTLMPEMGFTELQINDLTNYLQSLHRKVMPADYTPIPPYRTGQAVSGGQLYTMFCSGCHGSDGQGSTVREPDVIYAIDAPMELMVPSLNNTDTLALMSDDYLNWIIEHGREGSNMIGWATTGDGGLQPEEIRRLVSQLRSWQMPAPDLGSIAGERGEERIGGIIYQQNCASCHGREGEGGIGASLNSPTFLAVASDKFLARSIINGRPNTAMSSWRDFDPEQISDIIAHLRSRHPLRSQKQEVLEFVGAHDFAANGNARQVSEKIGQTIYQANCATCHGASGEGDLAPSISTQEFLSLIDDEYLYETIAHGRAGTGMPAWRHFSSEDTASLIRFINRWRQTERRELSSVPIQGDWDAGRFLFAGNCAGCHGET